MSDINELRRLTQAALTGPDGVSLNWLKLLQDFQKEANPAVINELLDRLEEAESDCLEQARMNGMGAERELALMAKLEAAERDRATFIMEIGNLCTKVEALREELSKQQSLSQAAQQLAEVAQRRADALRAKIEQMEKQEPHSEWFSWLPEGTTHISKISTAPVPCFGFEARFNAFKYIDGVLFTYRTDSDNEYGSWVKAAPRYRNGVLPVVYPLYALPGAQGE